MFLVKKVNMTRSDDFMNKGYIMKDLNPKNSKTPVRYILFSALACIHILTAGILGMVICCSAQQDNNSLADAIQMKKITVKGVNISYIDEGEGMPIVLVHGIPTSSFLWRAMVDELTIYGRVVALDLPGFGFSDPPIDSDYSISNYTSHLESFLDALAIEGGVLICHDFGGPVTVMYALQHPEKYSRLIILDTFLHTDLPDWGLFYKIVKIKPIGEVLMGIAGESIIKAGMAGGLVNQSKITNEIVRRYFMPTGSADKTIKAFLGTLRVDYLEELKFIEKNLTAIDKPTLIVWGKNDAYLPLSLANRIHQDIVGSRVEIISDCGHFLQEDKSRELTKIIAGFLGE